MGIAILIVEHGAALDGILGYLQGDLDAVILLGGGGFDRQLQSVEGVAGVAPGDPDKMLTGFFI